MSRELPKPGAKYARYVPSSSSPSPAPPAEARSLPSSLNSQTRIPCLRPASRTPGHCHRPREWDWGPIGSEQLHAQSEWCRRGDCRSGCGAVQPRSLDELCLTRQEARHALQRPAENIYHDTPPLHKPSPSKGKCQNNNSVTKRRTSLNGVCGGVGGVVVTSQPKKASSASPHWLSPPLPPYPASSPASSAGLHHGGDDSVICQSCGKCRCQACSAWRCSVPRP